MAGKHETHPTSFTIPPQHKDASPDASMGRKDAAPGLPPAGSVDQKDAAPDLPPVVTMRALLDLPVAEPEWVVDGLLPTGVSLLAGPARVDKPLLANQLGLDVAAGRPFLGRFPLKRGRVLYLALAESAVQVRGRARTLLNEATCPDTFHFAFRWLPFRQGGLADLEDTLVSLAGLRLVIVDPVEFVQPLRPESGLSGGYRAREPRAPETTPAFFLPLNQLATRHNLAILLLHHLPDDWPANRRDPLAGLSPTGLTPASACNLLLTPTADPGTCALHFAGPTVPEQRLRLAFDSARGCWIYSNP